MENLKNVFVSFLNIIIDTHRSEVSSALNNVEMHTVPLGLMLIFRGVDINPNKNEVQNNLIKLRDLRTDSYWSLKIKFGSSWFCL